MQLARIERREARLRRIRAKLASAGESQGEPVERTPQEHHHIGVSQSHHEHIGSFLAKHTGDPAIKVHTIKETVSCSANTFFP